MFALIYIILPIFLADLCSGLFHWWEDRYGDPTWPVIGRLIVQPNIDHHRHPSKFCSNSYWYRNNTTMISMLLAAVCFYWCLPVCITCVILSQMNEVHSWAHKRSNRVVRALQRVGLLLSPRHHRIHHERPYDRNYCVLTNYLNPVLSRLRVWSALEFVVLVVFGAKPLPIRVEY